MKVGRLSTQSEADFRETSKYCDNIVRTRFVVSDTYIKSIPATETTTARFLFGDNAAHVIPATPTWAIVADSVYIAALVAIPVLGLGLVSGHTGFSQSARGYVPPAQTELPLRAFGECMTQNGYVVEFYDLSKGGTATEPDQITGCRPWMATDPNCTPPQAQPSSARPCRPWMATDTGCVPEAPK